ncbi:hypothetical protein HETIRDRAFT_172077 [Heterobasidion irregulare TC 32-1]|uniref:Uncharacterized protein n=1 Tax=Heterobasidion irregulare (strain TC 32-1) TaxID=747525 RepID=W4JY81_HETIT|nr:uncharacterized protein HETIRDRAFT_172077 [Heterobasidion irregulare TC 32-1]ETW78503.1 hypothetical protein HETIRDRAFT_172077 [Heterobasidion irregulare TC 32-1]
MLGVLRPHAQGRRAGEHEGGDRRHHDPQEALVRQVAQPRFAKRCFEHFILRWGMNTALEPRKEEKPPAPQQFFSCSPVHAHTHTDAQTRAQPQPAVRAPPPGGRGEVIRRHGCRRR